MSAAVEGKAVEATLDLPRFHAPRMTQMRTEVRAVRVEHARYATSIAVRDDLFAEKRSREDAITRKGAGMTDEEPTIREGSERITHDRDMDVPARAPQPRSDSSQIIV